MLLQGEQQHRRKPVGSVDHAALAVGQGGQREEGSVDEGVAVDKDEPLLLGLGHNQSLAVPETLETLIVRYEGIPRS